MLVPALTLAVSLLAQSSSPTPAQSAAPPSTPPSPCAQGKFWPQLREDLKHDFTELISAESAATVSAGAAAAVISHRGDDRVARWSADAGASGVTGLGRALGSGYLQAPAILATWTIAGLLHDSCKQQLGSDLARATAIDFGILETLKYATQRRRPHGGDRLSFPSGHTASTFAIAAVLDRHFGWKVGLPAYGLATYTGWSRLRDDQHWLSDVVFGGALGFAIGRAAGNGHGKRAWIVAPATANGGIGLMVVRRANHR